MDAIVEVEVLILVLGISTEDMLVSKIKIQLVIKTPKAVRTEGCNMKFMT